MCAWSFGHVLRIFAVAVVASFILVWAGWAQQLTPQQFQASPGQVLTSNRAGGAQLTSLIRQLALADRADLAVIMSLLANASPDQGAAIGAGLGQAALALARTNQPYANQIQQALAAAGNTDANTAYAAVTGNQPIGAVGGGGGGSPGGVGGQTNGLGGPTGGTGGVEGIGGGGTTTGTFSATGSASAAGSVTTTGTTTTGNTTTGTTTTIDTTTTGTTTTAGTTTTGTNSPSPVSNSVSP